MTGLVGLVMLLPKQIINLELNLMRMKFYLQIFAGLLIWSWLGVQQANARPDSRDTDLRNLQQQFVDLKFGMFIHFNIPTFMDDDWADPEASPAIFNPVKQDCGQMGQSCRSR